MGNLLKYFYEKYCFIHSRWSKVKGFKLKKSVIEASYRDSMDEFHSFGVDADLVAKKAYVATLTDVSVEHCAKICLLGTGKASLFTFSREERKHELTQPEEKLNNADKAHASQKAQGPT